MKTSEIFKNCNDTLIWSCDQGIMGEIYLNQTEDAAMAILGAFCFFAGKTDEELVKFKPESCQDDFIIMVPENDEWAALIEKCYKENAKKLQDMQLRKNRMYLTKPSF